MVEKARQKALDYGHSLPNFICTQETRRDTAKVTKENQPTKWKLSDTLTIQLGYFEQKENYHVVAIDGKPTSKPIGKVGGHTALGDFGSNLNSVFDPKSQTNFRWDSWETMNGRATAVFSFTIDRSHSTFMTWVTTFLKTKRTNWAVKGQVVLDAETLDILCLTFESVDIPDDFPIRATQTKIEYSYQTVGGKDYLLPRHSMNTTTFADGRIARADTTFSDYKKFTADAGIVFDPP